MRRMLARLTPMLVLAAAALGSCKGGSPATPRAQDAAVTVDATLTTRDADADAVIDASVGPTFPGLAVFATAANAPSATSFFEF